MSAVADSNNQHQIDKRIVLGISTRNFHQKFPTEISGRNFEKFFQKFRPEISKKLRRAFFIKKSLPPNIYSIQSVIFFTV